MVHPNISGILCGRVSCELMKTGPERTDANCVPIVGKDLLDAQVPNNHIGRFLDQPSGSKRSAQNLHLAPNAQLTGQSSRGWRWSLCR